MKLITKLTALSLVICASMMPIAAQAGNNYQTQQVILNNFNNQEQVLANLLNTYVSSGQLSPQQGQVFNNELNQIASQSMAGASNPAITVQVMNELTALESQITASLGSQGQWLPVPVYSNVHGPSRYSWRPRSGGFQHDIQGQRHWQSSRELEQRQFQNRQIQDRAGMARQANAYNVIDRANLDHARAVSEHQQKANESVRHANAIQARTASEHQQQADRMIARSNGTHNHAQERDNEARDNHR